MTIINPFIIDIPEEQINDLHTRIRNTRWPDQECVEDWTQGIPLAYTKELAEYWLNEYDWRTCEAKLNSFDQYTTTLQDLDIHFLHQRSPHENAFPLLITHGWPGSIVEFHKIIDPLTNPTQYGGTQEDAFHVVCPTLPGYGFSGKPTQIGWGVEKIAKAWDELMVRLGYETYGAQGGDWGAAVTTQVGRNVGNCSAIHLNMPIGRPTAESLQEPNDDDKRALERLTYYQEWDSGYSTQQKTRPQTIGYGLVDSPVGQMSWIIEKFWSWMDCDDHPENVLTKDELLDNVMMYWLTASGASSARLYWESFGGSFGGGQKVEIPTGVASFPGEILQSPRTWCENSYNITHWTTMPVGGHFAAFEQPDLLVSDLQEFFKAYR